jgi:glycosyltransferase involved in cell wall biosynthesis
MATIHPLHTADPQHNMPFDEISTKADKIFSICGPYWYDTIDNTPFRHWKPKITRLDMAVDGNHFPYLRTRFNEPGKRKLVYIGSNMPMKNVGYLYNIMQLMPDVRLHWYGGDGGHPLAKLPNVDVTGWVRLTPDMAAQIVNECDIFVNVSNSDANPTTLLEAMAWGIITACTKESGYWKDPLFTELYLNDPAMTVQAIRGLLEAPGEELMQRAAAGRAAIETKYTWDLFCRTIWNELEPHLI